MATPRVNKLVLTSTQRQQLYRIRRRATPHEGCALLLGTFHKDSGTATVVRVVEMENVAHSQVTFIIDPIQQYQILEAAAQDNLELIGIFHSHPAPPRPSHRDLQFMEHNPCVWVIDGIQKKRRRMKAFQLLEGQLYPVSLGTIT